MIVFEAMMGWFFYIN